MFNIGHVVRNFVRFQEVGSSRSPVDGAGSLSAALIGCAMIDSDVGAFLPLLGSCPSSSDRNKLVGVIVELCLHIRLRR